MSELGPNLEAFDNCYYETVKGLTFLAMRLIGDHTRDYAEATNIVHDVFLKLHHQGIDFTARETRGLLYVSVKNRSIDYHRKRAQERKQQQEGNLDQLTNSDADDEILKALRLDCIWREITTLPPKQQEYLMDFLSGMSADDIAEKHGISKQTYYNHKSAGIRTLIRRLRNLSFALIYALLSLWPWKK